VVSNEKDPAIGTEDTIRIIVPTKKDERDIDIPGGPDSSSIHFQNINSSLTNNEQGALIGQCEF